MLKYLNSNEADTINNMNREAQNTSMGSAIMTAGMGNIGWKEDERYYVDDAIGIDTQANDQGKIIDKPFKTIQYALNIARYLPGTTTLDYSKNRRKYVFVCPGQYNEQLLFSGYNISLIGLGQRSNGDYGVVINYDDAVAATAVIGFTGSGLEIANICINSTKAIPLLLLASVSDACHIHHCWLKGDNAKTVTMGISAAIKNSVIEDNIINGCITGIDVTAGAWFNNSIVRRNKITNCTNLIAIAATAVCTESEISDNAGVGSATGIVNGQATDILIYGNHTKPAVSDAGSAAGDNTTLA